MGLSWRITEAQIVTVHHRTIFEFLRKVVRRNKVKGNLIEKGNFDEADVGGEQAEIPAEIARRMLNEDVYSAAEPSSRQRKWQWRS